MREETFDAQTLRGNRILRIFYVTEFTLLFSLVHRLLLGDMESSLFVAIAIIVLTSVLWFNKKQRFDTAATLIILTITALMLLMIWLHEGMRDELLLTFPALICFSILIGSQKLFKYVFVLIATNIILIAYVNESGIHIHETSGNDYASAVVILTIMSCITYVIGLLGTDITKANKTLNDYKASLEDKVQARTQELESSLAHLTKTQNELVESEKMASLGRLVAGISHEINTPIGIAVTATSHLQEHNRNFARAMDSHGIKKSQLHALLKDNQESAQLIHTNLERAHDLIGDFKNVSVIQSAQRRTEINLKDHLKNIVIALKPKLLERQIITRCTCPDDLLVRHDPQALTQIFTNIIMNSMHHGIAKGTTGSISLDVQEQNGNVTMVYKDSGKGISEEVAENIFEPFYTTNRGEGGSGLGMHIVFNLVSFSLMGSIECMTNTSQGAEFVIQFPAYPDEV